MKDLNDLEEEIVPLEITTLETWPAMLPMYVAEYEVSLGQPLYDYGEIAETFGINVERIDLFKKQPGFRAEVRAAILEIKDSDSVIKRKAKAQAELYLDSWVPKAMSDPAFPSVEKTKLFMFVAKMGRIVDDPQEKIKVEAAVQASTPQAQIPTITINLTGPKSLDEEQGVTITQIPEKLSNGN